MKRGGAFWASGDTDSEPESGSDGDFEASQERALPTRPRMNLGMLSDSDSDDNVKRVVRSHKDKRFDAMNDTIKKMRNHMKINDWNAIHSDFEALTKQMSKANTIVMRDGTPRFFVKALVMLEDFVNETAANREGIKRMSSSNAKSFNTVKQKIRKNNRMYVKQITAYRADPDAPDADSKNEFDSDNDDLDDDNEQTGRSTVSSMLATQNLADDDDDDNDAQGGQGDDQDADDDDDDDDFWASDDDDDDFSSEDSDGGRPMGRDFWKKRPAAKQAPQTDEGDAKGADSTAKAPKKQPRVQRVRRPEDVEEEDRKEAERRNNALERRHNLEQMELTPAQIDRKLRELLSQRGRRNIDRSSQIEELKILARKTDSTAQLMQIKCHLISALFSAVSSLATSISRKLWVKCHTNITELMELIKKHPEVQVTEDFAFEDYHVWTSSTEEVTTNEDGEIVVVEHLENSQSNHDTATQPQEETSRKVLAPIIAFLFRLCDEFTKSLRSADPHTGDYVERLSDESLLLALCRTVHQFYTKHSDHERAALVSARIVEFLHYKYDAAQDSLRGYNGSLEESEVHKLAVFVYRYGDERAKGRTMLHHVYYFALHNQYYSARDMLLMSHLQDTVQQADIPTQIVYNRTLAQLGLCAFRHGLFAAALNNLSDLCSTGRVRELLAQGLSSPRFGDKTSEQEKLEKQRQIPYHMHINLDMLECVHLICAMLQEVPNTAAHPNDYKRKFVISKTFRKHLEIYDRQVFTGPPENSRDHVMAAARAMLKGDWKLSVEFVMKLNMWKMVPNAEQVQKQVREQIQSQGLRTFLLSYSSHYASISLAQLCDMYELTTTEVHGIVSKMMVSEELQASWDQPTESIVMHKAEPTRLQTLALQFAEKAAFLVESNERLFDQRTVGLGISLEMPGRQGPRHEWRGPFGGGGGNRGGHGFGGGGGNRGGHGFSGGNRGGGRFNRGGGGGGGGGGHRGGRFHGNQNQHYQNNQQQMRLPGDQAAGAAAVGSMSQRARY